MTHDPGDEYDMHHDRLVTERKHTPSMGVEQAEFGAAHERAQHLALMASGSYRKHCGPRACKCAEQDLLGMALEALRCFLGVDNPPAGHPQHVDLAGAAYKAGQVLALARGEGGGDA